MKLYLAGPMRGHECYNFPAFRQAASVLRSAKHEVISPHELDEAEGFDCTKTIEANGCTMDVFLMRDLAAIAKVDGVCVLPGWERSQGTIWELHTARMLGKSAYPFLVSADEPVGPALQPIESHLAIYEASQGLPDSPQRRNILRTALFLGRALVRKNHDYGDSIFRRPQVGRVQDAKDAALVRMSDKISRINRLMAPQAVGPAVPNESLLDTFYDLAGYALLVAMGLELELFEEDAIG